MNLTFKSKLIALSLILATTNSHALELELGIGHSQEPWYFNLDPEIYPKQHDDKVFGKIGLYHTFWSSIKPIGIKVWAEHYSLVRELEPVNPETGEGSDGKNALGVSLVFKIF